MYCVLLWSRLSTLASLPHLLLFPFISSLGLHPSSDSFVLPNFLVFCLLSSELCHLCFLLLSFITVQCAAAILILYEGVNVPRSHFVFRLAPPKRLERSTGKLKQIPLHSRFSCSDYARFPLNQGNELFIHSFIHSFTQYLFSLCHIYFSSSLENIVNINCYIVFCFHVSTRLLQILSTLWPPSPSFSMIIAVLLW